MMRALLALASALLCAGLLMAGPNARAAKLVTNRWDMSKAIRGLPVMMVLRQEGNLYPSYWGGRNISGTLTLVGREDTLTDDLVVESQGGFVSRITCIPPKLGMEDLIPGGAWMREGRNANIGMEFLEFSRWRQAADRRGEAEGIRLEATYKAILTAAGKSVPVTGLASVWVHAKIGMFELHTDTTVQGADLGLEGMQAGPIQLHFRTRSASSGDLPPNAGELEKIDIDR